MSMTVVTKVDRVELELIIKCDQATAPFNLLLLDPKQMPLIESDHLQVLKLEFEPGIQWILIIALFSLLDPTSMYFII